VTSVEWQALRARSPDDVVVATRQRAWTRSELEELARAVAGQLAARAVGPGDAVVVALPNSIEFVAAALAARLRGATVVNVPFQWRREIVAVADETEAAAVVVAPGKLSDPALAPIAEPALTVDLQSPSGSAEELEPAGPAWLAYSSGTTGRPKGAVHNETTLGLMVAGFIERYELGAADPILIAAPLGHAVGYVYGFQLALASGAPMALLDRWDVGEAAAAVERHRCSFMAGPTPFLADIVDHASPAFASLRYLLCGGAPVPLALLRRAREALPGTLATAYYGSSECGGVTTCPPDAPEQRVLTTDGRPLPGMQVRTEGSELLVRGQQLAAGYRGGDPEGRFRDDGWFATGDSATVDAEGWVRIRGRLTELIRRGGVAVAPTEVEEVIAEHDQVRDVAVVGLPDPRLGERVAAVVVTRAGGAPSIETLRELCDRSGLAKVKWPESVIAVEALPRSPSGKLLRREIGLELERC
jgi:acyl-CoA synthetase (AMP-forming)/AMP-acid ligase II